MPVLLVQLHLLTSELLFVALGFLAQFTFIQLFFQLEKTVQMAMLKKFLDYYLLMSSPYFQLQGVCEGFQLALLQP